MSYRLKFANQYNNFVTDIRTASIADSYDLINKSQWKVYPNQADKMVYIEHEVLQDCEGAKISQRDLNIRIILSKAIHSVKITIDN